MRLAVQVAAVNRAIGAVPSVSQLPFQCNAFVDQVLQATVLAVQGAAPSAAASAVSHNTFRQQHCTHKLGCLYAHLDVRQSTANTAGLTCACCCCSAAHAYTDTAAAAIVVDATACCVCPKVCSKLFGGVDGLDLEVMFCNAVQTELFRATQQTGTPGVPTPAAVELAQQPVGCSSCP